MTHSRLVLFAAVACLWCALLLAIRMEWSGRTWFGFMAWNLFLAAIPLGLGLGLQTLRHGIQALPVIGGWLLFFPNAPYVMTDLMHLKEHHHGVPVWFDLLLLISFALVALWMGFQSMRLVQDWVAARTSMSVSWAFVFASLMLSGFGIYLGRFQRWNSWDIISRPGALMADIGHRIFDPVAGPKVWGVTLGFGSMLVISYIIWTLAYPVPQIAAQTQNRE